jgi:glycosyltransferase involved in cell wall biosynthesis/tetratricopeptide (TPR) repeat protein
MWQTIRSRIEALAADVNLRLRPGAGSTRIKEMLRLARSAYKARRLDEAVQICQRILVQDRANATALRLLARAQSKADPQRALVSWSRFAELQRQDAEPWLQMARIWVRQRRFAEAVECFRAALDREPDHQQALAGYGHALATTDFPGAVQHFTNWMKRRPLDAAPQLELARLYETERDWNQAEAICQEVLERDPGDQAALEQYARLLSRDSTRIDRALDLWSEISQRAPNLPAPFMQRAHLLERVGQADAAEAEYRNALGRVPQDETVLLGLGRFLSNHGRWREAADLFETVRRHNPKRTDVLLGLGRCLEHIDRDYDALDTYRQVLELDPTNGNALLYRGRLLRLLGRIDEAIDAWREASVRMPRNADTWHELVFMLAGAERELEAVAALDAAEEALPASAQSYIRLALTAEAGQFHDRAVAYFTRAIADEPDQPSHQGHLGEYYFRQGILDGAFHHLLASRELNPTELSVTKRLVETVHVLNELGIDQLAMRKAPERIGEVLIPERLFYLARRIAETEVVGYEPVPRRVIAVSASLGPGGAERQLVNMLRGLSGSEFALDLSLFCISLSSRSRRDFFLPLLAETPVEVVTVGETEAEPHLRAMDTAPFARLIQWFPEEMVCPIAFWLEQFRRRRPQVVHAWQDGTNLTAAVAALLAGVPRIVLCCRSLRPSNPRRTLRRFMKEAYRAVIGHPAVVLTTNSHAGAIDYAEWLGIDPAMIEVIYNGIDFDRLERKDHADEARRIRARLGIPIDAPVLGSAFRMSEEKRPVLWVEVAAAVARRDPRVHFIVCGDGPGRTEMATRAAALGIGDRLHLPGTQTEIAPWYEAMNVVMLTSRFEGLPNAPLEAQCLGLPVVAPDVGGMSETVRDGVTGWMVRDADATALAERVLFCLANPDWTARAAAEAPSFVKERFGIPAMLRRTVQVYGIGAKR